MKLKNAVKEIIAPALKQYGFSLTDEEPRFYYMESEPLQMSVSIEVPPRCPFYLFSEYLDILVQKKAGNKEYKVNGYATLDYSIAFPDDSHVNLSGDVFEPFMGVSGGFVYYNSQDLEVKSLQVADEIVNIVIPFMKSLSKRFVAWSELQAWQEPLQLHFEELAQYAADLLNLPEDRKKGYMEIEPVLFSLRGEDETGWRKIFFDNIKTIVGVAAYLGECIAARASSTEWKWDITPPIITSTRVFESTKTLYLSARYTPERKSNINLLEIIRDLWNYAPYIKCRHIVPIIESIPGFSNNTGD